MTTFYISRHGEAEPYAATDAERPLTLNGCEAVKKLWETLREQGVQPVGIISSPYVRAQQTAAIIASVFGELQVQTSTLITPDASVSTVFEWLEQEAAQDGILFVSHMPLVGKWVGQLTQGLGAAISMPVAGVAAVTAERVAPGEGVLHWLEHP